MTTDWDAITAQAAWHHPQTRFRADIAAQRVRDFFTAHPDAWVSWSGGKDSTTVLNLARQVNPKVVACWFDSGLEFPETVTYVHDLADRWGIRLHVEPAAPTALQVMVASGGWDHTAPVPLDVPDMFEALINGPAGRCHDKYGPAHMWGLRAAESRARTVHLAPTGGITTRTNETVTAAPIWDWQDQDVLTYLTGQGIPVNPVYDKLTALGATGRSLRVGVAFDGTNLEHGRATWLARGWPDLWAQICAALPRAREWGR